MPVVTPTDGVWLSPGDMKGTGLELEEGKFGKPTEV
jgi:hypothetical protein